MKGEVDLNGEAISDVVWLEEFQTPDDFVIQRGQYKGRAIKTWRFFLEVFHAF